MKFDDDEEELRLTKHGRKRLSSRVKLPKRATKRAAEKAFLEGKGPKDYTGEFARYLARLEEKGKTGDHVADAVRVHGNYIYLFQGSFLITVFMIPKQFHRLLK